MPRCRSSNGQSFNDEKTHSCSDLPYKVPKEVIEELVEELGEEEEEEEQEGDKEEETVAKALHGQRFPLPNY